MTTKEIWEKDKSLFKGFDFESWNRYYRAINREVPVEKVKDGPYYLDLTDGEKICYQNALEELKKERETFPQASYEVRLRDFD